MTTGYFLDERFSFSGNARLARILDGENKQFGKVERSIAYMTDNTDRPLRVSTLAALVNLSPSRYFELFKRKMGCTPKYYFTRLRMSHACRLLGSTSAIVKEVALTLGYNDPLYFSRVFKAVNNVPPSRYMAVRDSVLDNGTNYTDNANENSEILLPSTEVSEKD